MLDLNIKIINKEDSNKNFFGVNVYDKRDAFKFDVVRYLHFSTDQSHNLSYGVFGTQLLRYFRICNNFAEFISRADRICQEFTNLGYSLKRLRSIFNKVAKRHSFKDKFHAISNFTLACGL